MLKKIKRKLSGKDALGKLLAQAEDFRSAIEQAKKSRPLPEHLSYFGYDILGNIPVIDALLEGDNRELIRPLLQGKLADIGAADGHVGFFFESLGATVDIIDYPPTNWNGMAGVKALHDALGSQAGIHEIDIDSQFTMPQTGYDLIFLLGILYHLKNPYYILEQLAHKTKYLFLTTKIARYTRAEGLDMSGEAVAYLLDPKECNNDPSNYWVFSRTGLNKFVGRTGWEVLNVFYTGDTEASNPQNTKHDERACMFLRSMK